jgi:integrase
MTARRGNGEGSIRKRADGKWEARVRLAGKQRSVYGKTRAEVQRKLKTLIADADKGVLPPSEKLTLAEHVERWLQDVVKHSVRPRTYRGYGELMRRYALPTLGDVRLTQLQPPHVQQLYGELLERGLSVMTVHHVHTVLHQALQQAVKWNLAPRNVTDLVEPPRPQRKEVIALTSEQVRTLLGTSSGTRTDVILRTAVSTGMRQSELMGLRWSDVDLESGTIYVSRQYGRDGDYTEPKTSKSRRRIDLPETTSAILRAHRTAQLQERLAATEWEDNDLVFCTRNGRPLIHRNVLRDFALQLRKADLPHVPFHALRHTHASLLLQQGVHPKVVQERLGHSTIAQTLDTYSHLTPSMGREAADKLGALLA